MSGAKERRPEGSVGVAATVGVVAEWRSGVVEQLSSIVPH